MPNKVEARFQFLRDIEANWNTVTDFIPMETEVIIYLPDDTHPKARVKLGDGKTTVKDLEFYFDPDSLLELDQVVTEGSSNAVSGGAVYTAINNAVSSIKFPSVDQEYSPTSKNAQSGVALSSTITNIDNKASEALIHSVDFASSDDGVHGIQFTEDGKVRIKDKNEVYKTIFNPYKTYTAVIDETQEDPDLAVSYEDDAKGLTAQSDDWMDTEIFKDIRPCVFRDGKVQCYLDPNDFTQQIKNKEPMFYDDDTIDVKLDGRCSYMQIIQSEDADVYTAEGQKAVIVKTYYDSNLKPVKETDEWVFYGASAYPTAEDAENNTNKIKGYVLQGGGNPTDKDRNENITVCYKDKGYMQYDFDVPVEGDYYLVIRFNSQVSNAVRQHEIAINNDEHQLITFPQKGKQYGGSTTYWDKLNSRYVFQLMRQCVHLEAGKNSIKVFTPADYWSDTSAVGTIEIDFIALQFVETPDIYSGTDYESFGAAILENVDMIDSRGKVECKGQVISNAHQCLQYAPTETKTCDGEKDYISFEVPFTEPLSEYPILKICCNFYNKDRMEDSTITDKRVKVEVNAHFTFNDGTVKKMWGATKYENRIYCDGSDSYIYVDLTSFTRNGNFSDVNISLPISKLDLKPWYNNGFPLLMQPEDYFNIHQIALYRDWDVAVNTPASCAPSGDVMIEIPKMGYRFNRDGNVVNVSVTRDPGAVGFSYDAFVRTKKVDNKTYTRINDYIYVGAYPASTTELSSVVESITRIRSLSGKYFNSNPAVTADGSIPSARELSEFNNTSTVRGYGLLSYFPYTLIGALNLLYRKSICSSRYKVKLPTNESGFEQSMFDYTGVLNNYFNFQNDLEPNYKFIGLENIISGWNYGDHFIDYVYINSNYHLLVSDISSPVETWKDVGEVLSVNQTGHKRTSVGNNTCGFICKDISATESTFYCCRNHNLPSTYLFLSPSNTGMFNISSGNYLDIGHHIQRLMYSQEDI